MENLGLDFKLILAQIINFTIVFFIIKKNITSTFLGFLQSEKESEAEKERMQLAIKQKMEELGEEERKLREKLENEAQIILDQAREKAEKAGLKIIKQAEGKVEELKIKARRQIEEEKKMAEREARKKIAELSITIVNKALKDYLTNHLQEEATQYIIKNFAYKKLKDEE